MITGGLRLVCNRVVADNEGDVLKLMVKVVSNDGGGL